MTRKPIRRDTETGDTIATDVLVPEDPTDRRLLRALIMGAMPTAFFTVSFREGVEKHRFELYGFPQGWIGHELAVRYDLTEDRESRAWLDSIMSAVGDGVDDGSSITLYAEVIEDERLDDDRDLIVRWRAEPRTTTRWELNREQSNHAPYAPVIRWTAPPPPSIPENAADAEHLSAILESLDTAGAEGHHGAGENQSDTAWEIRDGLTCVRFFAREGWGLDTWRIGSQAIIPHYLGDRFCAAADRLISDLEERERTGELPVHLDLSADEYRSWTGGVTGE